MVKRAVFSLLLMCVPAPAASPLKALIVDGQNNHAWQATTPVLKRLLEETGLFTVDVATTPPAGGDMRAFQPGFAAYRVVISNYNGDPWPPETKAAFEKYMREGGGFVCYHAADNAFPEWPAYNEMIAVGGWGGRTAASGRLIRFRGGKVLLETTPGQTGNHGKRVPFLITVRDADHPITRGLPVRFLQSADELYNTLRGPAKNFTLLATAWSDPANSGTGENEPMLLAVRWGKGRVFHTALGHDVEAMKSVAFIATFQRGAEWAATGRVTQKAPGDFPGAERPSVRE